MPAGGEKTPGIDQEHGADLPADRAMGVAIDNAVCLGKFVMEKFFKIIGGTGPVDQADGMG